MISIRREAEKFIITKHRGVVAWLVLGLLLAGWVSSAGVLASPPGTTDEVHTVSTLAQSDDESAPVDSQVADGKQSFDGLGQTIRAEGCLLIFC